MESKKLVRWPRLLLGVIVLLFAGVIYAWSILKAPFASEFGWGADILGTNYTFTISFFCLGGFFSGLLTKWTTPRIRMIISAVLSFLGFFIASRLDGSSHVLLYLSYGVLAGTGIGFTYNTVISVTNAWYPDRKGLCSGVLMMAFGFSSMLIGQLAGRMMNNEAIGWRTTFLAFAIAIGAIMLVTAFLLKPPPVGTVFPEAKQKKGKAKAAVPVQDYTAGEMIRRLSFWKLFIFMILLASVGNAAISFAKDIALDVGASETLAVTLVGVLSVMNGVGRLISGALSDINIRLMQYVTSALAIFSPLIIVLAITTGSLPIGVIGLCLCGVTYGFTPTTASTFSNAFFGPKNFSLNFSIVNLILVPSSFVATLAGKLYLNSGSFVLMFVILAACSVVGFVINMSMKKA